MVCLIVNLLISRSYANHIFITSPESEQITNSLKMRGATNIVQLICNSGQRGKKIVTSSSGNHGMACVRKSYTSPDSKLQSLPKALEHLQYFLDCLIIIPLSPS